jgi:hypothetical protein
MPRSSIVFTEQEEIMKPRRANITSWLCASLCIAGIVCTAAAQENKSLDQELAASRVAIQKQQYDEAIRLLNEALTRFPGNRELRVELGRAYLYDHRDEQAMKLFREVLREDPSDRAAKLQLARALGYRRDYSASNKFYRELLAAKPEDEASSLGLLRNLTYQRKTAEARQEVARALAIHPNSLRLQEYKQRLSEGRSVAGNRNREEPRPAGTRKEARLQNTTDYFSDSVGNRSLRASQLFEHQITPAISNRVQAEERSLWTTQGSRANVFSGTDEIRVQVNHSLEVGAGGGTVRFADGVHRVLYRGTLLSHPSKYLWLEGGFSRFPIYPTYRAAQFDLLAEGWRGRVDWQPGRWRINATWNKQHYSDGNRSQREEAEVLRWMGRPALSLGAGYRFTHAAFEQHFFHGYFSPSVYQSHLGQLGVIFRSGKVFRGEYIGRIGEESIGGGPYHLAWEIALRNRARLGNWELGADYMYFNVAQNTGAFRAQGARVVVAYTF